MHRKMCIVSALLILSLSSLVIGQTTGGNKLTIKQAIDKAVENNPRLKVLSKEIAALRAVKVQSGLPTNPEFSFDAENIFGRGDYRFIGGSEITAQISQKIQLAGKISKREKVAEADILLAEWDYKSEKLKIKTEVKRAFNNALVVKKLIEKENELIKLSNNLLKNIEMRVKAGKISLAEISRTKIIINSLKISLTQLRYEYKASLLKLKSLIYERNFNITDIEGDFDYAIMLPPYDELLAGLNSNPILKKYRSEFAKRKAVLNLENSKAVPDLTISAGYKRLNEVNANTFVFGASIPIPLFNRNQGSIQEAEIIFDQKREEFESTRNNMELKLSLLYNRLITLQSTADQLKNKSIPETEKAFRIIKEGNQVGRFAILDVLDTQRTLFELQNQYLTVVSEIQSAKAELEGLIAKEIK